MRTNEAQSTIINPISSTGDIFQSVNVFPNPVRDIPNFQTDEKWMKAEIYDVSGRIMRSFTLHGTSIDVGSLESGTYVIKLRDGDVLGNVKFVKILKKIIVMKNVLILLFLVFYSVASTQILNFPDPNFKNALVNMKCVDTNGDGQSDADADFNNDGEIDLDEALQISALIFQYAVMINLDGISNFVNLKVLKCHQTPLQSMNLQGLNNLNSLTCSFSQLTKLNLQGLANLSFIDIKYSGIKSINVTGLTKLNYLNCDANALDSLFIKTGSKIPNLSFTNNRSLSYICCNENEINEIKIKSIGYGITNCEINSYCSFIPEGKFYILSGVNTFDGNNNGCDNQDMVIPNTKYNITNGIVTGTYISNSTGTYSIPFQTGIHTIRPILEHPNHFEVTPSSITVTFPATTDTITQNFCITPKGTLRQTNITTIPLSPPARPGFNASYKIVWENAGNQIENGTLNFTYNEALLDYIKATLTPNQIANSIVSWNFINLLPFEKREITVTLKVNRPTDTPPVNAGDKLYLKASIQDNVFTLENTVVGSYDPNDKTCLQGDRIKPDIIGKYVDYLIRFENTGNNAAENVVVKDIIDTKIFDVSTLQITNASHRMYTRIEGNKIEFIFENINLPFNDANNDGYIAFKIKTLPMLVVGDSLKNKADIYFDYNFAIRTNEARSTINNPISSTGDIVQSVNIFPNPVIDFLNLQTNEQWTKAQIYDISGRIIRVISLDSSPIDVSSLESGVFFVRLFNGIKEGQIKFVKF